MLFCINNSKANFKKFSYLLKAFIWSFGGETVKLMD